MDWKAIAELLADRTPPTIVIDRALHVLMLDERLALLLGLDRPDTLGARLETVSGMAPLRPFAVGALESAVVGGECTVVTPGGRHVDLTVEAVRAGTGAEAAAMLVVPSAVERSRGHRNAPDVVAFEYEIHESLMPFGHLRRLAVDDEVRHYWLADAPRCHEVLHGCSTPCADCPALRLHQPFPVTVRDRRPAPYELLHAERRAGRVRISVGRVREEDLAMVHRSRLSEAIETARLSAFERAALSHLGESAVATAAALGTSPAHIRQHQAEALRKLGASGRADVLCLLL
ncbi:MAG: hypothetical protein BGO98_13000 [Myxococcales bacterium 68-20]|nr:hypothetical protein [Myxococcales bacterium]OJY17069.1 MAG: hypothetical protein BGO98_13000 [Myxococcales bacterium 68-20]